MKLDGLCHDLALVLVFAVIAVYATTWLIIVGHEAAHQEVYEAFGVRNSSVEYRTVLGFPVSGMTRANADLRGYPSRMDEMHALVEVVSFAAEVVAATLLLCTFVLCGLWVYARATREDRR